MFITKKKLNDEIQSNYHSGVKVGIEKSEAQVKNLKKTIARLEASAEQLQADHELDIARKDREIDQLRDTVDALVEEQVEYRDTVANRLENEATENLLNTQRGILEAREEALNEREKSIDSKADGNFKKGYADGISDGLRKIGEITQKDRDNAMKVALVSASSHTPIDNLKEINSVHQITSGSSDK